MKIKEEVKEMNLNEVVEKRRIFEDKEGLKSTLMEEAALQRGFEVKRISFDTIIVTIDRKKLLFKDMNGPFSSAALNTLVDDKYSTRSFVRSAGLKVPQSIFLRTFEKEKIIRFANEIGYPVVIKPNNLARGQGIFINIDNNQSLINHLRYIAEIIDNKEEQILIEKQFIGEDFRFVVVDGAVIAVSQRARANIVGDGERTVLALIEEKNQKRFQDRDLKYYLIPTEKDKLISLYREGRSLNSIPDKGETVILRDESNISSGGEGIDFTENAHTEFKEIAIKAVQSIPGLHYAGVDVIAKDITEKPTSDNYVVTEVEFSPGAISMFPWKGEPRDMANPILDFYEKNLSRLKF